MVSAEEIAHVVQHVLASESTETEAQAIAKDVSFDIACISNVSLRHVQWGGALVVAGICSPEVVVRHVWNSDRELSCSRPTETYLAFMSYIAFPHVLW